MMDLYCSLLETTIQESELQLISVSCLMISTKYYEMKYPSASSLNSACKNQYSYEQIITKEGVILKQINWDMLRYTILDFVEIYINQGCLFESDEVLNSNGQI